MGVNVVSHTVPSITMNRKGDNQCLIKILNYFLKIVAMHMDRFLLIQSLHWLLCSMMISELRLCTNILTKITHLLSNQFMVVVHRAFQLLIHVLCFSSKSVIYLANILKGQSGQKKSRLNNTPKLNLLSKPQINQI
jgi:hypothetical protein